MNFFLCWRFGSFARIRIYDEHWNNCAPSTDAPLTDAIIYNPKSYTHTHTRSTYENCIGNKRTTNFISNTMDDSIHIHSNILRISTIKWSRFSLLPSPFTWCAYWVYCLKNAKKKTFISKKVYVLFLVLNLLKKKSVKSVNKRKQPIRMEFKWWS